MGTSSYPLFAHEKGCFQRLKVRVLIEPTRFKQRKGRGGGEAGDVPLGLRNLQPIPDHDQTQPRSPPWVLSYPSLRSKTEGRRENLETRLQHTYL